MLDQLKTLTYDFRNIKAVRVQDIHLEDCLSSWYIVKNMTVFPRRFIERNKFKVGLGVNGKHS